MHMHADDVVLRRKSVKNKIFHFSGKISYLRERNLLLIWGKEQALFNGKKFNTFREG